MTLVYRWYRGTESLVERCRYLLDKAYGCGPGEHLAYTREDYHSFPPEQWGTPVGAGSQAGTNIGAAAIEATRQTVIEDTNQLISSSERAELLEFFAQDEEIDVQWWYDEDGELIREQGALMENPPAELKARILAGPPPTT